MEINKCFYCKQTPTIVRLPGDLFYVQCTCDKHGLYDYLGATKKIAIDAWNRGNYSRSQYNKGGK